jgi:hypothetical protein
MSDGWELALDVGIIDGNCKVFCSYKSIEDLKKARHYIDKLIEVEGDKMNKPESNRAIIVVDRGWIFAGDVKRENGRIKLSRAVHVFKWVEVGFAGIIENTRKADLRKIADVDIPEGSEIFCVPVSNSWGL